MSGLNNPTIILNLGERLPRVTEMHWARLIDLSNKGRWFYARVGTDGSLYFLYLSRTLNSDPTNP